MLAAIGGVVQQARSQRGWPVSRLATEAGISIDVVEALELGRPGVTTVQLAAIARALAIDVRALRKGLQVARAAPSVYLRHRNLQDFHDSDCAILDEAVEHAHRLKELSALVATPSNPWTGRPVAAPHDRSDAAARHGYQLATEVRKHLNEPARPFEDLRHVVEARLGVVVLIRPLSSRVACAVKTGDAAAIVLDASTYADRPVRAQGAIAHELSHLLHDPAEEGVHVVLDREHDRSADANEQRARAHAAEMLLPRPGLQGLLGLPRAIGETDAAIQLVARAMDHFGTSWELTANHLCNRGFIVRDLRVWLESAHAHPAPATWTLRLPAAGAPSLLLAELTRRAHQEGLVTDGEARALLGLQTLDRLPWDLER